MGPGGGVLGWKRRVYGNQAEDIRNKGFHTTPKAATVRSISVVLDTVTVLDDDSNLFQ